MSDLHQILDELRKPFHPSVITWKPGAIKGERALAMPYADLRAYMTRLDDVCDDWSVAYEPWGADRIICQLTIGGVTRSSTGETTNESEKSEIGGTVAEAQAFKRASAMFGLGRYLYQLPTGWADWDAAGKKFTDQAKAKLTGILVQHYRHATGKNEDEARPSLATEEVFENPKKQRASAEQLAMLDKVGKEYYKGDGEWERQKPTLALSVSTGITSKIEELQPGECAKLIDGLQKRLAKLAQPEVVT